MRDFIFTGFLRLNIGEAILDCVSILIKEEM
jgi:hypothetical protein